MNKYTQDSQDHDSRQGPKAFKGRFPSSALLMSLAAVVLIAATTLLIPANPSADTHTQTPETANQAANANEKVQVAQGCELLQTLSYTRCEHTVTRRVAAPVELYGKTLSDVQALYEEWQVTEFSAKEIKMSQQPDLYCAEHMVLLPNEAGLLCVFENKYGDALALVNELQTELSSLPAAMQEEVRLGIGFSSLADLEQWLENAES